MPARQTAVLACLGRLEAFCPTIQQSDAEQRSCCRKPTTYSKGAGTLLSSNPSTQIDSNSCRCPCAVKSYVENLATCSKLLPLFALCQWSQQRSSGQFNRMPTLSGKGYHANQKALQNFLKCQPQTLVCKRNDP